MAVHVQSQDLSSRPVRVGQVRALAERMLEHLGLPDAELSVLLCSDAVIHELNRDFRKKDRPTDVLAFAMQEGEGGGLHPDLLGDVVISLETARRQAKSGARAIVEEVTILLAHGLLHLLGYDHQDDAEEARMNLKVEELRLAASR